MDIWKTYSLYEYKYCIQRMRWWNGVIVSIFMVSAIIYNSKTSQFASLDQPSSLWFKFVYPNVSCYLHWTITQDHKFSLLTLNVFPIHSSFPNLLFSKGLYWLNDFSRNQNRIRYAVVRNNLRYSSELIQSGFCFLFFVFSNSFHHVMRIRHVSSEVLS